MHNFNRYEQAQWLKEYIDGLKIDASTSLEWDVIDNLDSILNELENNYNNGILGD